MAAFRVPHPAEGPVVAVDGKGDFSWKGLQDAAAAGAAIGLVTMGLGRVAGKGIKAGLTKIAGSKAASSVGKAGAKGEAAESAAAEAPDTAAGSGKSGGSPGRRQVGRRR